MTTNDYQLLPMTTDDYQWLPMTTNDYILSLSNLRFFVKLNARLQQFSFTAEMSPFDQVLSYYWTGSQKEGAKNCTLSFSGTKAVIIYSTNIGIYKNLYCCMIPVDNWWVDSLVFLFKLMTLLLWSLDEFKSFVIAVMSVLPVQSKVSLMNH